MKAFINVVLSLFLLGGMALANNGNDPKFCHTPKPPTHPVPPPKPPKPQPKPTPKPKPVLVPINTSSTASANAAANASANVGPITNTLNAQGGNASLSNSGNSTNTNNVKQGQEQSNTQSQSTSSQASNNSNGNNSNNTTYNQPRQTPMAYAPDVLSTVNCFKGVSAGGSTPFFGATFGGGKVDKNCRQLAAASFAFSIGAREAGCKIFIKTQDAREAGITLADCLAVPPPDAPKDVVQERLPVSIIPPITALAPPPHVDTRVVLQACDDFTSNRVTNVCRAKLDEAVLYFKDQEGGYITVEANQLTGQVKANNVVAALVDAGINITAIQTKFASGFSNVVITYTN